MTFPSGGPPSSRRSTEQMADQRYREWEARQKAAGSSGAKTSAPAPSPSGKALSVPPEKDLDFDDGEESVVGSDGKGK